MTWQIVGGTWQRELGDRLTGRLPAGATHRVAGSAREETQLDGWSDLDLHVDLGGRVDPVDLLTGEDVWACAEEISAAAGEQVLRVVLADGRRLDLVVHGGRVLVPPLAADNDVRWVAVLAAAKLGRGDRLIGLHLVLDLLRRFLEVAMQVRDRDLGTTVHRSGSGHDVLADEATALLRGPLTPRLVEGVVDLYGTWRGELEPDYVPDWSGLSAVIRRGLRQPAATGQ